MRLSILNVPIDALSFDETMAKIIAFAKGGGRHHVITANPEIIDAATRDPWLYRLLSEADLVTADGHGVLLAARLLGQRLPERVTGIELAEALVRESGKAEVSLYFLGAKPGVAREAAGALRIKYPDCRIVGTWHGYFRGNEDKVLQDMTRAKPDILLCGLGSPMQERWIAEHQEKLGIPVAIGVGGSFDVLSGQVKRAPRWIQSLRLEWLYRILSDPSRLPRAIALPRFVWQVLKSRFHFS